MDSTEVKQLVQEEVGRLFGGGDHVRYGERNKRNLEGQREGQGERESSHGTFFQRFLEVMTTIHQSLDELTEKIGSLETRLKNVEYLISTRKNVH